ncbi:hypothetical protein BKA70DRAFT_1296927 [Coprinopsis sp. MPI-PUGE-AT-0042]|nr:hypothetical protein BKA70DRAFT_1296927 [Coprinopsis sp. MPI-PUGE-AT-0042]
MFSSPFGYQRPVYHSDSYYPRQWGDSQQPSVNYDEASARARALAAQRARRAQWLPDEVDEHDDDWEYNSLPPRERMLLEAARRRQQLEQQQRQQEYARQRALEEARWQQQLEQRQREEDVKRQRILEEQRRIQQAKREREEAMLRAEALRQQSRARSRSRQEHDSPSRSPVRASESSSKRTPPPRPTTPMPQYDERHEEAASKIQNQYRIHRSFQTISNLESQFNDARNGFTFPLTIDFQQPGSGNDAQDHIPVPVSREPDASTDDESMDLDGQVDGKLAYTSNNFSLNAYLDGMLKLLTKLDGVESWGEKAVRERRRSVVKEIEKEMSRVDRFWKGVWRDHLAAQREAANQSREEKQLQGDAAVDDIVVREEDAPTSTQEELLPIPTQSDSSLAPEALPEPQTPADEPQNP